MSEQSTCALADQHTPQPSGYMAWQSWVREMVRTRHSQRQCRGCGKYEIWTGLQPLVPTVEHERTCLTSYFEEDDAD